MQRLRRRRRQSVKPAGLKEGAHRFSSKAKKLDFPCDESQGHSDKYTKALNHLIMHIGNLDIQPRKTNVKVTFIVNSKRAKVEAYIDSGNFYFDCMAKEV